MFLVVKEAFPQEYAQFLNELAQAANQPGADRGIGFELGQRFTSTLLRDNAHHIKAAPSEAFWRINRAQIAVLNSLQDTPYLCGRFLVAGGGGLTQEETGALDLALVGQLGTDMMRAAAAGRLDPVPDLPATDTQMAEAFALWSQSESASAEELAAIEKNEWQTPAFCSGFRDYFTYLDSHRTDLSESVARRIYLNVEAQ